MENFAEDIYIAMSTVETSYEEMELAKLQYFKLESALHRDKLDIALCMKKNLGTNGMMRNVMSQEAIFVKGLHYQKRI